MVNVNKKYLHDRIVKGSWALFKKEVLAAKSDEELKHLLGQFFAPTEKIQLEKRLAILYLLKTGMSYREIGRAIDVAPATISFVKKGFKKKLGIK